MPAGHEPFTQRLEVVDLAVEGDPDRAVLIRHRLAGQRREIDDRQTPEAETGPLIVADEHALIVGTSMLEPIAHGDDRLGPHRRAIERQFTADAAHDY